MTWEDVLVIASITIVTLVVSVAIAGSMLIRIPADYFKGKQRKQHQSVALWKKILKNAGGVLLIAVGLVLSMPGIPGQGLLMVLAGLMIVDIPGKYKVERKILSLKPIRRTANRLRHWRGRPPLQFPQTQAK